MLDLTATIQIQEMDAAELVTAEIYDEAWKIVGYRTAAQIEAERRVLEGKVFFGLTVTAGGKGVRIHSEVSSGVPETHNAEREHMLVQGFAQIASSIFKNFAR